MRWSEDGFNHLLHLQLAWVNGRFDKLFPPNASPNRAYAPLRQNISSPMKLLQEWVAISKVSGDMRWGLSQQKRFEMQC